MRLIDADELKEWVENWFTQNKYYHPYSKSTNIPTNELYDILERMPTVDIVRCKDCKYISTEGKTTRYNYCNLYKYPIDLTDFCSRGERKTEKTDRVLMAKRKSVK